MDVLSPAARSPFVNGAFEEAPLIREILNPAEGSLIATVVEGDAEVVDRAVQAALGARREWARRTPQSRAAVLLAMAERITACEEELARLESLNAGKPISVSRAEIPLAADALRFVAGAVRSASVPATGIYLEDHVLLCGATR